MSNKDQSPNSDQSVENTLSKTQLKKQAHGLQDLAREIAELPAKKRDALNLPPALIAAIDESKRITSHIAAKRHTQYMGKLLAKCDYQSIEQQLQQDEAKNAHFQVRDAIINQWLTAYIDHEKTLNAYLYEHFPHETLNELRNLVRNYLKKPEPPHSKKLFKALRELDNQEPLPPVGQLDVKLS
ncbi:ribosome biogenesis factor YjgA [Marinicella gelatinilytica]|uniref:ribosome biogenesis factor YjgA n=1 Tax=Marinicella gelatinilytica TaxID=2996017 RepID=UPI002260A264|nr:ribosome biogenesis factor YjgA [Marinicella gelatinilytica]MCX7545211.1 DUF615 domain-containing protein [Marinicella gelatinilytica]